MQFYKRGSRGKNKIVIEFDGIQELQKYSPEILSLLDKQKTLNKQSKMISIFKINDCQYVVAKDMKSAIDAYNEFYKRNELGTDGREIVRSIEIISDDVIG